MESFKRKLSEEMNAKKLQQDAAGAAFFTTILEKTKRGHQSSAMQPNQNSLMTKPAIGIESRESRRKANTHPPRRSAFLDLPEKLRTIIYKMSFQDIDIHFGSQKPKAPALVVTCKKTYAESRKIFYASATFVFDSVRSSWQVLWNKQDLVEFMVIYDLHDLRNNVARSPYISHTLMNEYNYGVIQKTTSLKWKDGKGMNRWRYLNRYEIGSKERQQRWSRYWPGGLLTRQIFGIYDSGLGTAVRRSNRATLEEANKIDSRSGDYMLSTRYHTAASKE